MEQDSHPSAELLNEEFHEEEMPDMIQHHYWIVLPYQVVRVFSHLKIAPTGVVPQRECHPHPIIDYSWNQVNQESVNIDPVEAMQFGCTLPQLLQYLIYTNPEFGPA